MKNELCSLIDLLEEQRILSFEQYKTLLANISTELQAYAGKKAQIIQQTHYQNHIYIRGLVELTNYCACDCYYCGIRHGNTELERYRLSPEQVLSCCDQGYALGCRTFVLQGGEDAFFTKESVSELIRAMKQNHPDCAVTLSLGERPRETYQAWFESGANRYLLRHETSNAEHYARLHPAHQTIAKRKECLFNLKEIGYQVGTGLMVGSPYQTIDHLAEDLVFIQELCPQMVGIGPFLSHHQTPFANQPNGTVDMTLFLLSLLRIMLPEGLLPATTALGSLCPTGREQGILAGANVIMPNLSPVSVRNKYMLYDKKANANDEAEKTMAALHQRVQSIGYQIVVDRGDHASRRESTAKENQQ